MLFFHLLRYWKSHQRTGPAPVFRAVFPAVTQLNFERIWIFLRGLSHHQSALRHRACRTLQAFRATRRGNKKKKKKKKIVQYFNPPGLSGVGASICMSRSHVLIPFRSCCCHGAPPPLPASFLFNTHNSVPRSAVCSSSNICNSETRFHCRG